MANKIIIRNRSNETNPAPTHSSNASTDVDYGELALNYHSGVRKLYFKDSGNNIREIVDSAGVDDQATALAIALG